jgi:hypothetical protein
VVDLHHQLLKDGDVLVFWYSADSKRGRNDKEHQVLDKMQWQAIMAKFDKYHGDGRAKNTEKYVIF